MISIKPVFVLGGVGVGCVVATSAVAGVLGSTGGETTGVEGAVVAVAGLGSVAAILGVLRWAVGFWDRQDSRRRP